jgi:hypothetical protein
VLLRQTMLLIPYRFKLRFRAVDASLAQQVVEWLHDDIDEALEHASEIKPALLAEDPFARWYRENVDNEQKVIVNAKRREKYQERKKS